MAGDVADSDDDPLVVLEVHRGVVAPHTDHRLEIAHDFEIAAALVCGNHAAVDTLGDLQVLLELVPIVVYFSPIWSGRSDSGYWLCHEVVPHNLAGTPASTCLEM